MPDWREDRAGSAEHGENPFVLQRMASGFAVIGDVQFLPGYCVLLASPRRNHLTDLPPSERRQFLFDMSLVGEAIERVYRDDGLLRVNYEIQGNTDAFLHAHIWPRYVWEDDDRRRLPVSRYPLACWSDPGSQYDDARHGAKRRLLEAALRELVTDNR